MGEEGGCGDALAWSQAVAPWGGGAPVGLGLGGGGSHWAVCPALSNGLGLAGICSGPLASQCGTHHLRGEMGLLEVTQTPKIGKVVCER